MPEALSNPITVVRSDGVLVVRRKGGVDEPNQPTPEQLDGSPNADGLVDTYKQLANDDPKAIEWRRKLGTMIIEELSSRDEAARALKQKLDSGDGSSNYHLTALPEGYVLWQHTKYFTQGHGNPKKSSHAGGGNDRQDAYLYGHPAGRKKRFRSPREFLPHLLWLSLDDENGTIACGCKLCAPGRGASASASKSPRAASAATVAAAAAAPVVQTPVPVPTVAAVPSPATQVTESQTVTPLDSPAPMQAQPTAAPAVVSATVPPTASIDTASEMTNGEGGFTDAAFQDGIDTNAPDFYAYAMQDDVHDYFDSMQQ